MKYRVFFDAMTYPYVVEAENEDEAIIAATNLYFQETGNKSYQFIEIR